MKAKKIAITLSGQWRFSESCIVSLYEQIIAPLQAYYDIGVFIHAWVDDGKTPEEFHFVESKLPLVGWLFEKPISLENEVFSSIEHQHSSRYQSQYQSLKRVFDIVAASGFAPDSILRTRMDLLYQKPVRVPENPDADVIYVPPVEGHEELPFDPSVVNDQIAYGSYPSMSLYMTLVHQVTKTSLKGFEDASSKKYSMAHQKGALKGIEGILNEYLKSKNIKVKFLDVFYKINRLPNTKNKLMLARLPFWLYGSEPNRLSRVIILLLQRALRIRSKIYSHANNCKGVL